MLKFVQNLEVSFKVAPFDAEGHYTDITGTITVDKDVEFDIEAIVERDVVKCAFNEDDTLEQLKAKIEHVTNFLGTVALEKIMADLVTLHLLRQRVDEIS